MSRRDGGSPYSTDAMERVPPEARFGGRTDVASGLYARCAALLAALPTLSNCFSKPSRTGHGQRKRVHSFPVFRLRPWKSPV